MVEQHRTDLDEWHCQCAAFKYSAYHICKHLVRSYSQFYPAKGDTFRQHRPPLLWIKDLHNPEQKYQHTPQYTPVAMTMSANPSLEELGLSLEFRDKMEDNFRDGASGEVEEVEEYSRLDEDMAKYDDFITEMERACMYARQEIAAGRERFRRLPRPHLRGWRSLVTLAKNARILDNSRRRRTTWSSERRGANLYRG